MSNFRNSTVQFLSRTLPVAIVFTLVIGLAAEEKPKRKTVQVQSKVSIPAKLSIQDIETALQLPSRLKFADSNRITLGDLIQNVADVHGIQIRIDKNLASLLVAGRETMLVAEGAIPGLAENAPHGKLASGFNIPFPVQVAPVSSGANLFVGGPLQQTPTQIMQPNSTSGLQSYPQDVVTYLPQTPYEAASPVPYGPPANPLPTYSELPVQNLQPATSVEYQTRKPVAVVAEPATEAVVEDTEPAQETLQLSSRVLELLLETEITTIGLTQPQASLESVLLHALDHVTTLLDAATVEEEVGYPFAATHAYDLALLYEKDHVLITTVAASNLRKTVKVYPVSDFGEIDAEAIAKVITKTIRPWSWRSQINSLVDQISADWPESISIPKIKIDLTGVSTGNPENSESKSDTTQLELAGLKAMGQLLSSGTIAAAHAMISGSEMMHYADPPTADIETLPGMLIITQSQGAHQEIKSLLEQLKSATSATE